MELCYQLLVQEKRVTQRELFYKSLCDSPDYFNSQLQMWWRCFVEAVIVLESWHLTEELYLAAYSFSGIKDALTCAILLLLNYHEIRGQAYIVDCSTCGSSGYTISGDLNLLEKLVMKKDAPYIFVVEKHAIFQRLTEDRVFNQIPRIFITAKGYPDIATRFFLHRMSRNFPEVPILGMVDWNPVGLAILCTFKFGSIGIGLEAYRYACNVKWLGLRKDDLELIPEQTYIPLKPRDMQIAKSLISSDILQDNYKEELAIMVQSGRRAEIEAVYIHGYEFLGKYLLGYNLLNLIFQYELNIIFGIGLN